MILRFKEVVELRWLVRRLLIDVFYLENQRQCYQVAITSKLALNTGKNLISSPVDLSLKVLIVRHQRIFLQMPLRSINIYQ